MTEHMGRAAMEHDASRGSSPRSRSSREDELAHAGGSNQTPTLGSGDFTYRPVPDWPRLPKGWVLSDGAGVGVDKLDRVYLFHRGNPPVLVFDRDGNLEDAWGHGVFTRPHAVHIAPDDTIFLTDDGDHSVRQCTPQGRVLLTIGRPGQPSAAHSGEPFNRCTHTALSPGGDIYVSDGYGNARVHKFAPDGRHLFSWGGPGTGPGEFNLPHNITCDDDGWVYVADRENHRIQVFDPLGRFETQWHNLHRPSGLFTARGSRPLSYVAEIGPYLGGNLGWPNLGPRISILSADGDVMVRLCVEPSAGTDPGQFISPHSIALDSSGAIYVGDVAFTGWPSLFPHRPLPEKLPLIQKFVKVSSD